MAPDASPGVEVHDDEAFALGVEIRVRGDVRPPVIRRPLRGVAELHLEGSRAFPQGNDLELLGLAGCCTLFLVVNIEDEVTGLLRLGGSLDHQLAVVPETFQPRLNVAGRLINGRALNGTMPAKKGGTHLRHQFLAAVGVAAKVNRVGDFLAIQP